MKTYSFSNTARAVVCSIATAFIFAGLAVLPARAALLTNYFSTSLPNGPTGTYDFLGAYWNTTSETGTPLAAFAEPSSITIGQNPQDFSGDNFTISWDISGTTKIITTAGTNITINSTNVTVTFNGTQNDYIDAASTITVASGSTLIWDVTHDNAVNFDNQAVIMAGGGTEIWETEMGGNDSALLTENMPGGLVVVAQSSTGSFANHTGSFTLTAGTLVFSNGYAISNALNLSGGKVFTISGGTIDNLSGAPATMGLGVGTYSIGGNFTFNGSSSLNLNTNTVALTANVTITNLSNTLTMSTISGSFGLTETGGGSLIIGGGSTYSGPTVVDTNYFGLSGSAAVNLNNTSSISFMTNSVFDLSQLSGQVINPNTLSLTNTTLVLSIPLNATTNVVVGNLVLGGTNNVIQIASLPVVTHYPTSFPLINYSNTLALTNFSLAAFPASPTIPYGGYLSASNANLIQLVLTTGPVPARSLTWQGKDPTNPTYWDAQTSTNWITNAATAPTTYNQLDEVLFSDYGSGGTTPGLVSLQTNLAPSTMVVSNNALNYVFTGGGSLTNPLNATLQLVKQGTGSMIMDNSTANTYSGGTLISGGTLQIGQNSDGNGSLGASAVVNNGTLVLANGASTFINNISGTGAIIQEGTGDVVLNGNLSGAQSITQEGAGTLNLGGANASYTGGITVASNSVLQAGSATAFGAASSITVQNGGILDLNGQSLGAIPVFANGAGSIPNGGSQGAIDNSSATAPAGNLGLQFLTLTGNTTLSTTSGRWDLQSPGGDTGTVGNSAGSSSAYLSTGGQPYNLTLQGGNFFGIVSAWVDPALANIVVVGGTFDYEGNTSGLGNPANTLTVDGSATFQLANAANPLNKVFVIDNSATVESAAGSNSISGPVTLSGAGSSCTFDVAAGTLNLLGTVSGQGTLQSTGPGTLILNGGNTFNGGIQETAGTLLLDGDNSALTNYADVNGATLVVNGVFGGATTNNNGGTIAGTGTNLGPVDVQSILAPGESGGVGTLTVGTPSAQSSLTLESSANANFVLSAIPTVGSGVNDLVAVNGNLTINSGVAININPVDLLGSGAYVLFTYTGALNVPGGLSSISVSTPASYNLTLSTNTPGEVTLSATANGTIYEWTGGAGAADTTWGNAANWGGVAIGAGDNIYFAGTASLNNTNSFAADTQFGNITFASDAGPFVLNGNNIEMSSGSGSLYNDSSYPQTVDLGVDFNGSFALYGGSSASAPLIVGGGLNIVSPANDTAVYLNGCGILTNSLTNPSGAGAGSNEITLTNNSASWTLMDNPSSTPVALPWGLEINAGTFTFGSATSAPNLNCTPTTGAVNGSLDTEIGAGTAGNIATFNMVNGTLTLGARIDVGELAGTTGALNQTGGTLNIQELQTGNENGVSYVNVSGGTMNIATNGGGQIYNATRTNSTVTITGGAINCAAQVDVSRCVNSSVAGIVNLNGGTLTCSRVGTATSAASATATGDTATFNFNGGTLIANTNSTTFYQGSTGSPTVPIASYVRSGGAIINDGGFAISILEPLQHDPSLGSAKDGGLTKLGTGTNTLGKVNTYNGPTVIGAGALVLSSPGNIASTEGINIAAGATLNAGGILTLSSGQTLEGGGNIVGSLTAGSGSFVTPGSAGATGTLTISGPIAIAGTTTLKLANGTDDEVVSSSSISYAGTLVVTNLPGNTLAAGTTFDLFHGTSYSGSFLSITLPALGANLAWQTNLSVSGSISIVSSTPPTPVINSFSHAGGNLIFSGTNGSLSGTFYVLTSTNLTSPLSNWTVLSTNSFSASGAFSVTNAIGNNPDSYFILSVP